MDWKEAHNASHRRVRARFEHTFAKMKTWKILRDCRLHGTGSAEAIAGIARLAPTLVFGLRAGLDSGSDGQRQRGGFLPRARSWHSGPQVLAVKAGSDCQDEGVGSGRGRKSSSVVGDNPERIRSEAAFAKLAGVCPIPTGIRQDRRAPPPLPRRQPTTERRALPGRASPA